MKIVFLGSGNVATHLAQAFIAAGQEVLQVWSKTEANAQVLADNIGSKAIANLNALDLHADLYLIAVKDEAINELAAALPALNGVVAHTSGATSIEALHNLNKYGVFYPLQTFSKQKTIDLYDTPLCLEASDTATMSLLQDAAKLISTASYAVDSEKRKVLHLSAVFACNFSNHLYHMGHSIMQEHGLDFEILKPLIMETARKVQDAVPFDVQTGPAVRGDKETMSKHLQLLAGHSDLQDIYKSLSESIKKTHL